MFLVDLPEVPPKADKLPLEIVDLGGIPACRQAGLSAFGGEPPSMSRFQISVDLPGVEPGPQQCECCVIPFYYKPKKGWRDECSALPDELQALYCMRDECPAFTAGCYHYTIGPGKI